MMANNNKKAQAVQDTNTKKFSAEEIVEIIAAALVTIDVNTENAFFCGEIPVEESILDSKSFTRRFVDLVEAYMSGNAYMTLTAFIKFFDNPKNFEMLSTVVNFIFNKYPSIYYVFEDHYEFCEWSFSNDPLLNSVWQTPSFNRKASLVLYAWLAYLTDFRYAIKVETPYDGILDVNSLINALSREVFKLDKPNNNKKSTRI